MLADFGLNRMQNFSLSHNAHLLVMGENGSPLSKIFQVTSNFLFFLLRSQINLLSDVCFLSSNLNEFLCTPKRMYNFRLWFYFILFCFVLFYFILFYFILFYFIYSISFHFRMSYSHKGQLTTDKNNRKLCHMYMILFPVLAGI